MKSEGPTTLPWGTPLVTRILSELFPLTVTYWVRSFKKSLIHYR